MLKEVSKSVLGTALYVVYIIYALISYLLGILLADKVVSFFVFLYGLVGAFIFALAYYNVYEFSFWGRDTNAIIVIMAFAYIPVSFVIFYIFQYSDLIIGKTYRYWVDENNLREYKELNY